MTTHQHRGSGAVSPAPRRSIRSGVASLITAALLLAACSTRTTGTSAATHFSTLPVHRVVDATPTRPQLAVQGDAVNVRTNTGQVLATVVGPAVPDPATPPPETTPCTFHVTLANTTGTVPIDPSQFSVLDELGNIDTLHLDPAKPIPPSNAPAGQSVTFDLVTSLPTGNGQIRWTPTGTSPIVAWDFQVEID